MIMTPPPDKPNRGTSESIFNTQVDAFLTWLAVFWTELASFVAGLNNYSTTSTSTTNIAMQLGVRTITVAAGKSYQIGMSVKLAVTADGTKWMYGDVTAYNDVTGALSFYCTAIAGSGSYSAWTLTASAPGYELQNYTDTGTANELVVSAPWTAYTKNKSLTIVKSNAANSITSPTLNVAGLGDRQLFDEVGNTLQEGALKALMAFTVLFDDTLNPGLGGFRCLGIRQKDNRAGEYFYWSTAGAPSHGLVCNGAEVSRATYAKLFSVIGIAYGNGNGTTTFNLPNMQTDFTLLHNANANHGTSSLGNVMSHTHSTYWTQIVGGSQPGYAGGSNYSNALTATTGATGAAANYAAGLRALLCIRYD